MIAELSHKQMEDILTRGIIGRIACHQNNKTYIVPTTYVYSKAYLYAHSKDGMKISMMRKNPLVCFQVDEIDSMVSWRSVIVWGEFQELTTAPEQKRAEDLLRDRFEPLTTSESTRRPPENINPPHIVEKDLKAILFRIKITEMTGRFEKPDFPQSDIWPISV